MSELYKNWAFWLIIGIIVLLWALPVKAQEVIRAQGVICDLPQQSVSIHLLLKKGVTAAEAMKKVNTKVGKTNACMVDDVFTPDPKILKDFGDGYSLIEIVVIAVVRGGRPYGVFPLKQYMVARKRGGDAPASHGTDA